MNYAKSHTVWNKLVRDKVIEGLEAKGIKTSYRIVEDKEELIMLLSEKLTEELVELEEEMRKANHEGMLQESGDVREIISTLFSLLKEYDQIQIEGYTHAISAMSAAEQKIDSQITQGNQELIHKVKDIQTKKREEKGGFEKGIFLISTDG